MKTIRNTTTTRAQIATKNNSSSNAVAFLNSTGAGKQIKKYHKNERIYSQGGQANKIFYIQRGVVKLTVVNEVGREAVVAMLGVGNFCGESCLADQNIRLEMATALIPSTLLIIEKKEMVRRLHAERALSDFFLRYMLARNTRIEQDLVDQLFSSSEKRLARTLLLLAQYGKQDHPEKLIANVSQQILAEMIGTTRGRVNLFMNKFKKLGFIDYDGGLHINTSLLSVVLHE